MDFGFKKDIENFLNQPEITKEQFDVFKVKYCLSYNLNDKKKLLSLFRKLEKHFENGVYTGPKNFTDIFKTKNRTSSISVDQKKKKKGKNNAQKKKDLERKLNLAIERKKDPNYELKIPEHIKPKTKARKTRKHPDSYYHLLKLKRVFLNKNVTLREFASELKYDKGYYLEELKKQFPDITLDSKLTEEHLKHGLEDFYYDYVYLQNELNDIVTKLPKTKPNYYKLIYTR